MNLFDNLFKSRRKNLYEARKTAFDDRKNLGNDYRSNMLKNSISPHIWRNSRMSDFIRFSQEVLADLVDAVNHLKIHKSYTMKKNDKKIR
tara:strand:+ start:6751 stop:7020 length:270 start_codon:yes stop_codon:yes gene_type:complete